MRILIAVDRFVFPSGGADRLLRAVATTLIEAGHEVLVLDAAAPQRITEMYGVCVQGFGYRPPRLIRDGDWQALRWNERWQVDVARVIEGLKPELVLAQNMLTPATLAAARQAGVRCAILFHGYRCMRPDFYRGRDALACGPTRFRDVGLREKLKWPLVDGMLRLQRAAYQVADVVVANSGYTALVIERQFGRPAELFYPILGIDVPPEPSRGDPAGPVLFVKPQVVKGVDLLPAIARGMPERRFLVAGQVPRKARRLLAGLPNVELRGWINDMPALYASASVLLGPSRIPEPFGRVFVEAGLHGLPSVATQAGGIPEAMGDGGVLVPMEASAEAWVAALNQALDPANRPRLCDAALAHARELVETYDAARLLHVLGLD